MGIGYFFGEVIAKSPANKRYKIVADNLPEKNCTRFLLDFNSVIHPCSAKYISKLNKEVLINDTLYHGIFDSIANYTIKLIDIVQPTDLVYIAVDGVAPRAKMHQQRKRRFLSAQRNMKISEFKAKNNIPDTKFDSNMITPGTEFMVKLDKYLNTTFRSLIEAKFPQLKELIISGSGEVGEGEQKMIYYINRNHTLGCDIIYGLDADLIMLSLTSYDANIVLMRESNDFGKYQSQNRVPFKYLVINHLRDSVFDMMTVSTQQNDDDNNSRKGVIGDYVFMCCLLGNDFVPSLSFLKIKDGAVDTLIECYRASVTEGNLLNAPTSDIENYIINIDNICKFIGALKEREDEMMAHVVNHYYNSLPKPQRNFNSIIQNIRNSSQRLTLKEVQDKAVEEFSYDLEEFPLRNKFMVDINPSKDRKWRNSYYHYIFGSNSMETIRGACKDYFEGLMWVTNYYFDRCASQTWYYPYHFAPCSSDLHKFTMSLTPETLEKEKKELMDKPTNYDYNRAHLQLLLVLPPQSKGLLPIQLQPIMTDIKHGCVHCYPTSFQVHTYLKQKMWETSPMIPNINVDLVVEELKILQD